MARCPEGQYPSGCSRDTGHSKCLPQHAEPPLLGGAREAEEAPGTSSGALLQSSLHHYKELSNEKRFWRLGGISISSTVMRTC